MQVLSFHPGAIFTPAVKNASFSETTMKWDDGKCHLSTADVLNPAVD